MLRQSSRTSRHTCASSALTRTSAGTCTDTHSSCTRPCTRRSSRSPRSHQSAHG